MPPVKKFLKEDIVKVAYEIVRKEGIEALNARRVAKELNSSVQPIFHNFESMDDLKNEVYDRIMLKYREYMLSGIHDEKAYKQTGLSYIRFAKDYPEFFKIIFMQRTSLNAEKFMMLDNSSDEIIKAGQELTGLSFEEQRKFHVKVWIFTHGIACLVATNTVKFTDEEIDELLGKSVLEMVIGNKTLKGGKK